MSIEAIQTTIVLKQVFSTFSQQTLQLLDDVAKREQSIMGKELVIAEQEKRFLLEEECLMDMMRALQAALAEWRHCQLSDLNSQQDYITKKEATLAEQNRQAKIRAESFADTLKLNVGGQIFKVAKATLLAEEDTFFFSLLGSEHWKTDADGEYYIDRPAHHFPKILDYLRRGEQDGFLGVDIHQCSPHDYRTLRDDIKFYAIGSLYRTVLLRFQTWRVRPICNLRGADRWQVQRLKFFARDGELRLQPRNLSVSSTKSLSSHFGQKTFSSPYEILNVLRDGPEVWMPSSSESTEWLAYQMGDDVEVSSLEIVTNREPYHLILEVWTGVAFQPVTCLSAITISSDKDMRYISFE